MQNLVYLAMAVGLSALGAIVLWALRHRPRSVQHEMDQFNRELRALRLNEGPAGSRGGEPEPVEPAPIRPRRVVGGTNRPVHRDPALDRRRSSPET
ncbi:MAG: hypothetical protein ACKV2O_12840 [Acidimicrobiales bacterium]